MTLNNIRRFNGGLDFSPESIANDDAKFHSKNVGTDKRGHLHPVFIPEKDTYRLSHPTTFTKPSLRTKEEQEELNRYEH
jgi:hypothetical protein